MSIAAELSHIRLGRAHPDLAHERAFPSRKGQYPSDPEESSALCRRPLEADIGLDEVYDAVEERDAELVEKLARLHDGRAVGQARGVDEQEAEDFEQNVRGEGEERASRGHGWMLIGECDFGWVDRVVVVSGRREG